MIFWGIRRDQIRPDTNLNRIIPEENRIDTLKEIVNSISDGKSVYVDPARPGWIKFSIYALGIAVFFSILWITKMPLQPGIFILSIVASLSVMLILVFATAPFKTEIPKKFFTVADLIRIIASRQSKIWDREELWEKIKKIIVEQLGVQEEDVQPDADFFKDLGMG